MKLIFLAFAIVCFILSTYLNRGSLGLALLSAGLAFYALMQLPL